jgi:hypothetical protein
MFNNMYVQSKAVPISLILVILMMGRYIPPKRRFLQEQQGVTSQNTAFFSE